MLNSARETSPILQFSAVRIFSGLLVSVSSFSFMIVQIVLLLEDTRIKFDPSVANYINY